MHATLSRVSIILHNGYFPLIVPFLLHSCPSDGKSSFICSLQALIATLPILLLRKRAARTTLNDHFLHRLSLIMAFSSFVEHKAVVCVSLERLLWIFSQLNTIRSWRPRNSACFGRRNVSARYHRLSQLERF